VGGDPVTEKIQSIYIKGKRHYPVPSGDTVPSVSTFLDILAKPALTNWKVKTTAEWAVDNQEHWKGLPRDAAVDVVAKSTTFNKDAATMGTIAHGVFEDLANGREPSYMPPGFEMIPRYWAEFVEEFQVRVEYPEPWLWNKGLRYAGSADLVCTMQLPGHAERITAIIDYKSGSGIYGSTAYQLAAYAMCDQLILDGGRTIIAPPAVTHTFGMWVRPAGWTLYPMAYDAEMRRLVHGMRLMYDWTADDWGYRGKAINRFPVRTKGDNWKIEEGN
jgi:hypothetical protein